MKNVFRKKFSNALAFFRMKNVFQKGYRNPFISIKCYELVPKSKLEHVLTNIY